MINLNTMIGIFIVIVDREIVRLLLCSKYNLLRGYIKKKRTLSFFAIVTSTGFYFPKELGIFSRPIINSSSE